MFNGVVLIVDDDAGARETLEALLYNEGYQLLFAESGIEALDVLKHTVPDVILLDVMMPGMDGFDVCRRVRAHPELGEVPIILVTALDDRESRLMGINVGADDFVTKPFDRMELRARVRTIVNLSRHRKIIAERVKFEWVVEHAEDGYLVIDQMDNILYANPKAQVYLGISEDVVERIEETFLNLASKQYLCEPRESWLDWPTRHDEPSIRYLVRPETSKSEAFWLHVYLLPMTSTSKPNYLIRLQEVTDKILTQHAMWSFQMQVNHKLRTPLTLLTGTFQLLDQALRPIMGEHENAVFSLAYKGVTRLDREIQSILRYANGPVYEKQEEKKIKFKEIQELIEEVKERMVLESIQVEIPNRKQIESVVLPISRRGMELILVELITNAEKFHPKQSPTIEVTISRVEEELQIQLKSEGDTLSPDQLEKIWVPYYQAEKIYSGHIPGMGLGLPMVASMVWNVGGVCRAFNRWDNSGIVIELSFPIVSVDK